MDEALPEVYHYECVKCGHARDIDISPMALRENAAVQAAEVATYIRIQETMSPEARVAALRQAGEGAEAIADKEWRQRREERAEAEQDRARMQELHPNIQI